MASTTNQQQPFPVVPPSLSAGDHEMRDYYAPHYAPRPTLGQTPYLKPYLGLRARLSQIWLNRWTILLLLVLIRLLFSIASTDSNLVSARREALSACLRVEDMGSSMASMPHYMARGVNEMTASGVENAVDGLMTMLEMSVTGVEEIILFVIHMMTSTYLCLITLAVSGSLHAAVEIGTAMAKQLNETIDDVTEEMGDAAKSVTDGINKVIEKINFFPGANFEVPSINLDDEIKKLKALEAPPELQQGLQKLNDSIPTFDEVQKFLDDIIRTPFEEVKERIRAMNNYTFDREILPLPQKEALSFCSEGNSINSFFDDLLNIGRSARRIGLGVLIALAVLVCVPMAWMEIRRYRKMELRAAEFELGRDPMDIIYLASRATSGASGLWFGHRFGSTRRQAAVRWAWAYATSVPMLFVLSLGIAGLFSCFCQFLVLRGIEQKVPELTEQVADFAGTVVAALDNASRSWSGAANGVMAELDDEINNDIFGWVNTTTTSVNSTLNAFVTKMSDQLEDTFGDTVLHDPIKEVLNCLIGLKIASFQKGLTWVKEHAHVSFPSVKNDTFSLGALAQLSGSDSAAELLANPNGKAKDEVTEAVGHVIDKLQSGIRTESLISTALIVIWLLVALAGLAFAFTHMVRSDENAALHVRDANIPEPKEVDIAAHEAMPPPSYDYPVNKAAPYTLQPRPFPTFDTSEPQPSAEVVGHVGSRAVGESSRPGHLRTSSHGQLDDPSPNDEKSGPFR